MSAKQPQPMPRNREGFNINEAPIDFKRPEKAPKAPPPPPDWARRK